MELQLVVSQDPDGRPEVFRFPDFVRVTLGRGPDSPVPLEGSSLSRDHVHFEMRDERLCVSDVSTNGSFVNGRRLEAGVPRALEEGDEVSLPGYRIQFRLIAPASSIEQASIDTSTSIEAKGSEGPVEKREPIPPAAPLLASRFRLSPLEWTVIGLALAVAVLALIFFSY